MRVLRMSGFLILMSAFVISASGCAGGKGSLTGKVTYKGKTVASGTVLLFASDGLPRYGQIAADGSYKIEDIPVGEVKLALSSPNPVPDPEKLAAARAGVKRGGREQDNPITDVPTSNPALWFPIPAELGDPMTSNIKSSVRRGENSFDIVLP